MALLDTTALIDMGRSARSIHNQNINRLMVSLLKAGETMVTSRINEAEFRVGGYLATDVRRETQRIEAVLSTIVILEFDGKAAIHYAQIQAILTRIGRRTGAADTFIAAVASANGQAIVTRNPRDFADIPGLALMSY